MKIIQEKFFEKNCSHLCITFCTIKLRAKSRKIDFSAEDSFMNTGMGIKLCNLLKNIQILKSSFAQA